MGLNFRNYLSKLSDNFSTFMNNDDVVPLVKYGVAPPTYMATDPRFDKRPNSQSTSASKQNSSMGPNPQAGLPLSPDRKDQRTDEQRYAEFIEGDPPASGVSGDISSGIDSGFYRQDPRVRDVDKTGKTNYQDDPSKGDPNTVRSAQFGYPVVEQTGSESVFDAPSGLYDRDTTEVNTPVVRGNPRAFQGSDDQFTNSPIYELGSSAFAPRQSQYYVKRDQEDEAAHPDQEWIQSHPNMVSHTVGHDHPFCHNHSYYDKPVEYSSSVGNRGTEHLVTQQ